MDHTIARAASYIEEHLKEGFSPEQIRQVLLQHHWQPDVIEKAFSMVQTGSGAVVAEQADLYLHTAQANYQAPAKYTVRRAIADSWNAFRSNTLNIVLSYVNGIVVNVLGLFFAWLVSIQLNFVTFFSASSLESVILSLLGMYIVLASILYVTSSFAHSVIALAFMSGAQQQKERFSVMLKMAFSRNGKVIAATFVSSATIILPLFLSVLLQIINNAVRGGGGLFAILGFILGIGSVVWAIIALLRYALVPYVALFESEATIRGMLRRSSYLLRQGGQWFLVKAFVLLFIVLFVFGLMTGFTSGAGRSNQPQLLQFVVLVLANILSTSVLVMLYKNRKAVKG